MHLFEVSSVGPCYPYWQGMEKVKRIAKLLLYSLSHSSLIGSAEQQQEKGWEKAPWLGFYEVKSLLETSPSASRSISVNEV